MAEYTTNLYTYLQSVASAHCDCTSDPEKLLNKYYTAVFDFDFPFFGDSQIKVYWEKSFLRRYLMEEIGLETIPLFKWYLQARLVERMPEWEMLWKALSIDFEPFDNYNITRERSGNEDTTGTLGESTENSSTGTTTNTDTLTRETSAETDTTDSATSDNTRTETGNTDVTRTDNTTQTTGMDSQQLVSDTPQVTIQTNDYASSLTRDEQDTTVTNTGTVNTETDVTSTVTDDGETSGTSHAETTGTETENDNRNEQRQDSSNGSRNQTTSGNKDYEELEKTHGWQGILPIDVIQKYREGVLSIYKIINDSMQDLFMGIF